MVLLSKDDLGDALTPNHFMYGENIRKKDDAVIPEDIAQDASECQTYISKILVDR